MTLTEFLKQVKQLVLDYVVGADLVHEEEDQLIFSVPTGTEGSYKEFSIDFMEEDE
tara:strand:+ start:628 stop:795 length:168 start_codon:yes stop_codon:yes gene_type:complete